jgi:hypothetical protein
MGKQENDHTSLMTILGCKTSHKRRRTYLNITTFWAVTPYVLVENNNVSEKPYFHVFMKKAALQTAGTLETRI